MAYERGTPEERFWRKVDRSADCWTWTASKLPKGYGLFTPFGRGSRTYAHRFSWELHNGQPVPTGRCVLHHCDNPSCVRPDHLWVGTPTDNMQDMIRKGRRVKAMALRTHCPRGHAYDEANTYRNRGERQCRTCGRERMALRRAG